MTTPPGVPNQSGPVASGGVLFHPAILALDPGNEQTGLCLWREGRIVDINKQSNSWVLGYLDGLAMDVPGSLPKPILIVEDLRFYGGQAFPLTLIRTAQWIGRFIERWPGEHRLIPRKEVVTALTGNPKAGDPIVRQACIDVLGDVPTKARPNGNYPRRPAGDEWSAIAIVLAFHELAKDGRDRALDQLI